VREAPSREWNAFCSRPGVGEVKYTWQPSRSDIEKLEANLEKVKRLTVLRCCLRGAAISNPYRYKRFYLGVVKDGRRLVYINATDNGSFDNCDGGTCCWGAFYDPVRNEFFGLAVNGIS
jgi:hypothetical protein